MKIERKDYVVVEESPGKNRLAKVRSVDSDIVTVTYTVNQHIQELRESGEIQKSSVIINLGQNPKPGMVYGCSTEDLYHGSTDHEAFGKIYWMYEPEKDVVKSVNSAFNIVLKRLKKFGLEDLAKDDIIWEAHPYYKQKWAGMYLHPKIGRSRILFRPEHSPASFYPYIIAHELGHRIHAQWLQHPPTEAKWVKLYNTSIRVNPVDSKLSQRMLKRLSPDFVLSNLKRELEDDEEKAALKNILRYIRANHGLSPLELNLLLRADEMEEVHKVWPEHVDVKELSPVISEYATKNFRETIAESIAFHLTGTALPKSVVKLTERTLSLAKANLTGGHAPEGDSDE